MPVFESACILLFVLLLIDTERLKRRADRIEERIDQIWERMDEVERDANDKDC